MKKRVIGATHASELIDGAGVKLSLGGRSYVLRALRVSDLERLQAFFYSHSSDTILLRYGHAVTQMTQERARDLVGVDQSRDLALAIFEVRGEDQIIHAVGRYCLDRDGRSAEVAFVVRETKRHLGMGKTLFAALRDVARERGLTHLWGRVRRDNAPMLALFHREGGQLVPGTDGTDGEIDLRVVLQSDPTPAKGLAHATRKLKTTPAPRPSRPPPIRR